jgi:hypothetical protein
VRGSERGCERECEEYEVRQECVSVRGCVRSAKSVRSGESERVREKVIGTGEGKNTEKGGGGQISEIVVKREKKWRDIGVVKM